MESLYFLGCCSVYFVLNIIKLGTTAAGWGLGLLLRVKIITTVKQGISVMNKDLFLPPQTFTSIYIWYVA